MSRLREFRFSTLSFHPLFNEMGEIGMKVEPSDRAQNAEGMLEDCAVSAKWPPYIRYMPIELLTHRPCERAKHEQVRN